MSYVFHLVSGKLHKRVELFAPDLQAARSRVSSENPAWDVSMCWPKYTPRQ